MEFGRRDFFGVIAAPLLRKLVPPAPMAKGPCLNFGNGTVSFATIEKVRSLSGPSWQFNPSADFWDTKMATLLDAPAISFDLTFEPNERR